MRIFLPRISKGFAETVGKHSSPGSDAVVESRYLILDKQSWASLQLRVAVSGGVLESRKWYGWLL
jgi:hypothetical protein